MVKQLIYLGPSMATSDFTLPKGDIIAGELPPKIKEKYDVDSDFKALFVPPEKVGKSRSDIANGHTFLAGCYERVHAEYIQQRKVK
ncbi:hypothetical protein I2492_09390 [Budviciaceae bacterium CWB-B4]|uniref:Uncharacterized protein n=1 Tax=Limnobaculum xujianqingii TaxID=2738837 RepID=A0A9D7FTF4_9GAMM|nr:hypothetical protein [Limnobaculum xujianqingii]MBK5073228.1 hypothetical protein [Limnobaculum xujianqingii]MBK5176537.1 hypothetical protein [Limnobaculum xujianqingii]